MFVFPFDCIKSGEKIIIYGVGSVGKDYTAQINASGYCCIVGYVDKNECLNTYNEKQIYTIGDLNNVEFDKIVIAIQKASLQREVVTDLQRLGIDENKIVLPKCDYIDSTSRTVECNPVQDEKIHIGLYNRGGLGDCIMDLVLAQRIRDLYSENVYIFNETKYKLIFEGNPLLDSCRELGDSEDADIMIFNHHMSIIQSWAPQKVAKKAPLLADFCIKSIDFVDNKTLPERFEKDVYLYCKLNRKKRIEAIDIKGILPINSDSEVLFNWKIDTYDVLCKYELLNLRYIVVNRDVDAGLGMENVKLWPKDYYDSLVDITKKHYPSIKIVQVGARNTEKPISGIDADLRGITTLEEIKVLLKQAMLLISGEGGLVHINHFLHNRSVVLFGPSDEDYFGYHEDFACVNRIDCGIPCNYIDNEYRNKCLRGYQCAKCMMDLEPELVYSKYEEFIDSKLKISVSLQEISVEQAEQIMLDSTTAHKRVLKIYGEKTSPFSPHSFIPNLPYYSPCFDLIWIDAPYYDIHDKYGTILELLRLVIPGGCVVTDYIAIEKYYEKKRIEPLSKVLLTKEIAI